MGVPTSEVGYTAAMPRREDHEVYKDMWWHWGEEKHFLPLINNNFFLLHVRGQVSDPRKETGKMISHDIPCRCAYLLIVLAFFNVRSG